MYWYYELVAVLAKVLKDDREDIPIYVFLSKSSVQSRYLNYPSNKRDSTTGIGSYCIKPYTTSRTICVSSKVL
ncbi:hypothetical protein EV102420_08_03150 [Pseudescherichia vulneris NBRC 102420]|uniref:Uncharacterized protein n=1 Tax=Pseudescherichia vulneris NBRC 102420 TaxID=1115515 RepID=A0A090VRT8_PSEVU|nr:hypothetical protein EV102420_08_03150 [Pseudescherichia vulneris NBRC 102420]STQ58402.1 Uncharacterised protein [Pseudescherichia vulneris]